MSRKLISFTIDDEKHSQIWDWLQSLPKGDKSFKIREAITVYSQMSYQADIDKIKASKPEVEAEYKSDGGILDDLRGVSF